MKFVIFMKKVKKKNCNFLEENLCYKFLILVNFIIFSDRRLIFGFIYFKGKKMYDDRFYFYEKMFSF